MKYDFDSYLPKYKQQIQKRLSFCEDANSKLIRYMDADASPNDQIRFQFHLPREERELFAGILFAHSLLSQVVHFYKESFCGRLLICQTEDRQTLFPEIIKGLLAGSDWHIEPTVIPLGVLYVDELKDDYVRNMSHLNDELAKNTWCRERELFENSVNWLKLNLHEKVMQLTGTVISKEDEIKLCELIDKEMARLDDEFACGKDLLEKSYASLFWRYVKKSYAFSWRFLLICLLYKFFITSGQFGRLASLFDIRTEGYDIYQKLEPYQVHAVSLIYLILRLEDVIALLLISLIPRCIVTDKFFRVNKVLTDLEWRIGFRLVALLVLCIAFNVPWRFF